MLRPRNTLIVVVVLVALFAVTAVAVAQAPTVNVTDDDTLGSFLTDGEGRTLYVFERDEAGTSNCYDQCAENWPPLTVAEGEEPMAGDGVTGELGVIERTTGDRQVTYNDMPLYYFAGDAEPGDTNGQGVGEIWYVVPPDATTYQEARDMSTAGMDEQATDDEATDEATQEETTDEGEEAPETLPETGAAHLTGTGAVSLLLVAFGTLMVTVSGVFIFAQRRKDN